MTTRTTSETPAESTGPAAWLLVGSEGLWAADCLVPGCGWTVTTGAWEAATAAADGHATTHATTEERWTSR